MAYKVWPCAADVVVKLEANEESLDQTGTILCSRAKGITIASLSDMLDAACLMFTTDQAHLNISIGSEKGVDAHSTRIMDLCRLRSDPVACLVVGRRLLWIKLVASYE